MIKKSLAYILIFSLVLSLCTGVYASEEMSYKEQVNFENAKILLSELGISDIGDMDSSSEMTRGEFVNLIYRVIKVPAGGGDAVFADVGSDHKYFKAISAFADAEFIHGNGGKFYPDNNITYNEALYIMLNMMGYHEYMELVGGFPTGGTEVARKLDIKTGKSNTAKDLLSMVYQSLTAGMLKVSEYGKSVQFDSNEEETILSTYRSINKVTGILKASGQASVDSMIRVSNNTINIDGVSYKTDDICTVLAGCEVDAFYDKDTEIVFCTVSTSRNEITEIKSEQIEQYANMEYRYKQDGRNKRIKVEQGTDIIYNYSLMTRYDENLMKPDNGSIIVIDNGYGRSYIYINNYIGFLVETIEDTSNCIYIYADTTASIKPIKIEKDINDTVIYNDKKQVVDVSKIKTGSVISVLGQEDTNNIIAKEIVISNRTLSGDLNQIYRDVNSCLVIDDTEYYVAKSAEYILNNLSTQTNMAFYLDFMGNVVAVSGSVKGGMAYGYIIKARVAEGENGETVHLKMFSELGSVITYTFADKVTIDGTRYKNYDPNIVLQNFLDSHGDTINQIIRYDVNSKKEINRIDLPVAITTNNEPKTDDMLYLTCPETSLYFRKSMLGFSGRVMTDENTIIFKVPNTPSDAASYEFSLLKNTDIEDEGRWLVEAYSQGDESICADVIVLKRNYSVYPTSKEPMIVKKITQTLNYDEEPSYKVVFEGVSGESEYTTKNEAIIKSAHSVNNSDSNTYTIAVGDIVRFIVNDNEEIEDLRVMYRSSNNQMLDTTANTENTFFNSIRLTAGNVYDIDDKYIKITYNDMSAMPRTQRISDADCEIYKLDGLKIITIDKTEAKIQISDGSRNDIKPFRNGGSTYSKVIVSAANASAKVLFVIKE